MTIEEVQLVDKMTEMMDKPALRQRRTKQETGSRGASFSTPFSTVTPRAIHHRGGRDVKVPPAGASIDQHALQQHVMQEKV